MTGSQPRFGVEEEFLVIDPSTRTVLPRATAILARASQRLGDRASGEITDLQVESKSGPCASVDELYGQLLQGRLALDACAREEGARIAASGTSVLSGAVPPPITEGARQAQGIAIFRGLHEEQCICALHVHVELPDRERAVLTSNHLRAYLPLLIALATNSPFWEGRDTGYASWRTLIWSRWPVAGPPPRFESAEHYDRLVARLLDAGALVDLGNVFWDVRPSANNPTLEVRIADVGRTALDSTMFAALVRALVVQLGRLVDRGEPAPPVDDALLRAAYWQAARDGIDGDGIDVGTGRLVPAILQANWLYEQLRPELAERGEVELVGAWLRGLRAGRSGAARQRAAAAAAGDLVGVVDDLIAATVSDDGLDSLPAAVETAHVYRG